MQIGDYAIHFRRFEDELPKSHKKVLAVKCVIHTGPCVEQERMCQAPGAFYAITQCSPKDLNRPHVGRKIALARALKAANLTKEQRTAFWQAFYAKMSIPKSYHKKVANAPRLAGSGQ